MFISIGPNCHPAGNLRKLKMRNQSLPFDWLLCENHRIFEYINDLINTNFSKFTTNLIYNHRNKVISTNYDYVEFFHHDLLKNTCDGMEQNVKKENEVSLIDIMNKRAKRFMDIISNEKNKVYFVCMLNHTNLIKDGLIINNDLYEDMINFDNNLNIKCNFKVLVYLSNDNVDYNLILPDKLKNVKNFIFCKYIRNQKKCKVFGHIKDFKRLLKNFLLKISINT